MSDTVEVRREGAAARIVLNRPEALNAWNAELGLALRDAVLDVAGDPEVRAVLLTGAGRAFSSGADLKDLSGREETTASGRPDVRKVLTERYHPIITAVREMPKPVVAAVNGPAVGIGLLAGARRRPRDRRGVGLPPAGLRERRARARRRFLGLRPRRAWASRARPRWRCSASGSAPRRRSSGAS